MRKRSNPAQPVRERVADGGSAAAGAGRMDFRGQTETAQPEYGRRSVALRDQRSAYDCMRKRVRKSIKPGGTAGLYIYPVPARDCRDGIFCFLQAP